MRHRRCSSSDQHGSMHGSVSCMCLSRLDTTTFAYVRVAQIVSSRGAVSRGHAAGCRPVAVRAVRGVRAHTTQAREAARCGCGRWRGVTRKYPSSSSRVKMSLHLEAEHTVHSRTEERNRTTVRLQSLDPAVRDIYEIRNCGRSAASLSVSRHT